MVQRFLEAQNGISPVHQHVTYATAMAELAAGKKTGHWIWYVFPQIELGTSPQSIFYSIKDCKEAKKYLSHDVLGPRYVDSLALVTSHVTAAPGGNIWQALHGLLDDDKKKFTSSITLFSRAAKKINGPVAGQVQAHANTLWAAGLRPCGASQQVSC